MALSDIQEKVERSVYERVRLVLVEEGFWPDITLFSGPTQIDDFQAAINQIISIKGFAIEPFGHGSQRKKYEKQVPRMVFVSRRMLSGSIGNPPTPLPVPNPNGSGNFLNIVRPLETADMQFDLYCASGGNSTAAQDRVMNAVVHKALVSQKGFIPFYDSPTDLIFIKQYNYYDLPNATAGIEEKVYSFQVDDLYLLHEDDMVFNEVAPITDITVDIEHKTDTGEDEHLDSFTVT